MATMPIKLVYTTGRTTTVTVAVQQPLLAQLTAQLPHRQVLLYDGGRVDREATLESLQVSSGDSFDVMMPAPRIDSSPLVRHLRREGLDPSRFEYYGHVAAGLPQ